MAVDTATRDLAETLHKLLCHHNHTDGCDWCYIEWDAPDLRSAKARYVRVAKVVQDWAKEHNVSSAATINLLTAIKTEEWKI